MLRARSFIAFTSLGGYVSAIPTDNNQQFDVETANKDAFAAPGPESHVPAPDDNEVGQYSVASAFIEYTFLQCPCLSGVLQKFDIEPTGHMSEADLANSLLEVSEHVHSWSNMTTGGVQEIPIDDAADDDDDDDSSFLEVNKQSFEVGSMGAQVHPAHADIINSCACASAFLQLARPNQFASTATGGAAGPVGKKNSEWLQPTSTLIEELLTKEPSHVRLQPESHVDLGDTHDGVGAVDRHRPADTGVGVGKVTDASLLDTNLAIHPALNDFQTMRFPEHGVAIQYLQHQLTHSEAGDDPKANGPTSTGFRSFVSSMGLDLLTTKEVCAAKFSKIWEWIFHYRQQDQPFNTNLKGTTDEKLRVVVRNLLGPVFAFLSDANVLKRLQKPFVTSPRTHTMIDGMRAQATDDDKMQELFGDGSLSIANWIDKIVPDHGLKNLVEVLFDTTCFPHFQVGDGITFKSGQVFIPGDVQKHITRSVNGVSPKTKELIDSMFSTFFDISESIVREQSNAHGAKRVIKNAVSQVFGVFE